MTGTARQVALAAIFFAVAACGGPSNDGAAPATPSGSSGAPAPPPAPGEPAAVPASGPLAATPSSEKGWPFTPEISAEEKKAQLERLAKDQGPLKTNWTPPGKSERYGHGEAL